MPLGTTTLRRSPRQQARWERDQEILAMRVLGQSLPSIAAEVGLTVEGVRQRVLRYQGPTAAQVRGLVAVREHRREQACLDQVDLWVRQHPGCTVEQLASGTACTVADIRRMLPALTSRARIARDGRDRQLHTHTQLLDGLRRVAQREGRLTLTAYRRHPAQLPLATPATVIKRFGSWAAAVEKAGLQPAKHRGGPPRAWTNQDLIEIVDHYLEDPQSTGEFEDFRRWLKSRPNSPSAALVMLRLGSWTAAKQSVARAGA